MSVETTKLELMHLLLQTQKESLLAKIKKVFEDDHEDWWSQMSKEEQQEIKIGLDQADKGNYTDSETVMERFEKWR
ncbi:hypothetical protein N9E56_00375 [Flavobacteriaceae bacterium]|nr:hypothetical protein [Flavobacteriaceae bacterium]